MNKGESGHTNHNIKLKVLTIVVFIAMIASCIFWLYVPRHGNIDLAEDRSKEVIDTKITLLFGGDVMQHIPQVNAARNGEYIDYSNCFQHMRSIWQDTDLTILNFETTVSANGRFTGYPLFASPPELVNALKDAGADILLLANNHICDKGSAGIKQTIETAEKVGLRYLGAYSDTLTFDKHHPLQIDLKGRRLAFINHTYSTNGMPVPKGMKVNFLDEGELSHAVEQAKAMAADHIIACLHWGNEYARQPHIHQKQLSGWLRGNGVDMIIGSHPHVVQPAVIDKDSIGTFLTAYSLGNLVSNQRWRYSDGGILLRVILDFHPGKRPSVEAEYIPVWVHTPYVEGKRQYIILSPEAADKTLAEGSTDRISYERFLSDCRQLMSGTGVSEAYK